MADRIIRVNNGDTESVLVPTTSSGAADAGRVVGVGADGKFDISFMPNGIGQDTMTLPSSEALTDGDFVNIWDDAGTTKVRKADNTDNTKPANGFVLAAVTSGANAIVYTEGDNTKLTGLTVGAKYFLGTIGSAVTTAPTVVGSIIQPLGMVKNATTLRFEQKDYIKNA